MKSLCQTKHVTQTVIRSDGKGARLFFFFPELNQLLSLVYRELNDWGKDAKRYRNNLRQCPALLKEKYTRNNKIQSSFNALRRVDAVLERISN